jgi:hypothetical protein
LGDTIHLNYAQTATFELSRGKELARLSAVASRTIRRYRFILVGRRAAEYLGRQWQVLEGGKIGMAAE